MNIIRKIRLNFDSLDELLLFLQIFFLITILPFLIKLLSIPRLMKTLTPEIRKSGEPNCQELKDKIVKYTDYILSRNFLVYRSSCLKRSLTLYHFLRKLGIDIQICFGIRYKEFFAGCGEGKKIEGHAWLLHNGDFFLEANSEMTRTYKMTYYFPENNERKDKDNRSGVHLS
jgi:hypothetical protein